MPRREVLGSVEACTSPCRHPGRELVTESLRDLWVLRFERMSSFSGRQPSSPLRPLHAIRAQNSVGNLLSVSSLV